MSFLGFKKTRIIKSQDSIQVHHTGSSTYELPVTPDSPYIVDDSAFIPLAEAVKQLGINPNFTGSDMSTAYDFPDGNDTGIEMPINRTKNGKDIAELSQNIEEQQDRISSELQKQKDFEDYQKKVNERMQDAKPTSE